MSKGLGDFEREEETSTEEQLEAILFQFVNLYDRMSEDREAVAKQRADIAKFVKIFAAKVADFGGLENFFREQISSNMYDATLNITSAVRVAATDAFYQEAGKAADEIRDAAAQARKLLSSYQSPLNIKHWRIIGVTLLSSIVSSLLAVWFLMPKPINAYALSSGQINSLHVGAELKSLWLDLPQEQKDLILNKINERTKVKMDSV